MTFQIRQAKYPEDKGQLMQMWLALYTWITEPDAEWESMQQWFAREDAATFVAVDSNNPETLVGYADVGERSVVEGAEGAAAYLEAWYVKEPWRKRGIGEALIRACADWARQQGYAEMGSDALLDNTLSHRLHRKFGFEEMERVVLFRMRLLSAILAVCALWACVDNRFMRVGRTADEGIPAMQEVDDSVHLVATEWSHHLFGTGPAIPNSDEDPDRYQWSSSNPTVAEVRPSGWMIARAPGQVVITVRGPESVYSQSVAVCSLNTYLQIDPDDPVIKLNDTITIRVSLRQPGGTECGKIDVGPLFAQLGIGRPGLEPILSQPNRWRAIRVGTFWYTSALLFAKHDLSDSILVTIR